ncbi:hypothetical protein N7G274_009638 [Stereocaulon virgatum]|uniref:C2H2-type domain-containing protein n=1 Tax=Stereocaulon virgatum TaxID=373712 RepID=A0ABR3ZWJ7_9LECA
MTSSILPNPRRCYKTRGAPTFASSQPTPPHHAGQTNGSAEFDRPLKKAATFHSPKSPSSDDDPILNIPLLSRRSPTCPKDLENAIAAGEQRIAQLLGSVDRSLSGLESFSSDSQVTLKEDDPPVPRFMLGPYNGDTDRMDVDDTLTYKSHPKTQHRVHNRHSSDSGLGSSISSAEESLSGDHAAGKLNSYENIHSTIAEIKSGINGSNGNTQTGTQHVLSAYACKQIQNHIIVPILKTEELKAFHPLVNSIPFRVKRKQITCLCDLEKVILWLAPKYSVTGSSFFKFCDTSIQCLHTTVEHLNESDRQRPTDRPYTNGYFLDLTEQVRQYAAMINASRERALAGKARERDDYTNDERLSLHGGLGQTGRPAELVRMKDGQAISLRTGNIVDLDASPSCSADEDLEHSMARRKKSEQAAVKQAQRCSECDKEFKRPCDLTKHEKTHSRPWKCNEPSCKYSQYGWPTEKERDRHVNDKHSVTPNMYKCQYHPCPYESKRESNCKQHMEKAHGWAYVRSKNNGKSVKKSSKADKTPPTPSMNTPGSHIFDASGSEFGDSTSPYMANGYGTTSVVGSTRASTSPYMRNGYFGHSANGSLGGSSHRSTSESPYLGNNETYGSYDLNITWDESFNRQTPQTSYTTSSHRHSMDSLTNATTIPSSYDFQDDPPLFGGTFDWNNMDFNQDFTTMNIQIENITPLSSMEARPLDAYSSRNPSISVERPQRSKNPNLSPGAHGNEMLYTPYIHNDVDEGYSEFTTNVGKPANDFALFDDSRPTSSLSHSAPMNLFNDLPPFQPTTWSQNGNALAQQMGLNDMMHLDEE